MNPLIANVKVLYDNSRPIFSEFSFFSLSILFSNRLHQSSRGGVLHFTHLFSIEISPEQHSTREAFGTHSKIIRKKVRTLIIAGLVVERLETEFHRNSNAHNYIL